MEDTLAPEQLGRGRKRKQEDTCDTDINVKKKDIVMAQSVKVEKDSSGVQAEDGGSKFLEENVYNEKGDTMSSQIKEEAIGDEKVEVGEVSKESAKLTVIIDGPSVGRTAKHLHLSLEHKLHAALDYFRLIGREVVIFFPSHMAKKLKSVSGEVQAATKLTTRKCSVTGSNPWALDKWEVLRFAVARRALLVSNDSYRDFTFEGTEFRDQIESRLLGFTWCGGRFVPTEVSVKEAAFPYLPSLAWQPEPTVGPTDRQQQILELEAREDRLVRYEREKLGNMREMEEAEKSAML
jgi:hypothetical protein